MTITRCHLGTPLWIRWLFCLMMGFCLGSVRVNIAPVEEYESSEKVDEEKEGKEATFSRRSQQRRLRNGGRGEQHPPSTAYTTRRGHVARSNDESPRAHTANGSFCLPLLC